MQGRALRRSCCGAAASWLLRSGRRRGRCAWAGRRGGRNGGIAGRRHFWLLRLLGGLGELHGPGALLAGIDLEEAGAVIAVGEAIADAADRELAVARAHVEMSGTFAASIVVDGIDIIKTCDEVALEHGLAGARRQVPPAFGGPAVGIFVADRDADPARRVVAQPEVG